MHCSTENNAKTAATDGHRCVCAPSLPCERLGQKTIVERSVQTLALVKWQWQTLKKYIYFFNWAKGCSTVRVKAWRTGGVSNG